MTKNKEPGASTSYVQLGRIQRQIGKFTFERFIIYNALTWQRQLANSSRSFQNCRVNNGHINLVSRLMRRLPLCLTFPRQRLTRTAPSAVSLRHNASKVDGNCPRPDYAIVTVCYIWREEVLAGIDDCCWSVSDPPPGDITLARFESGAFVRLFTNGLLSSWSFVFPNRETSWVKRRSLFRSYHGKWCTSTVSFITCPYPHDMLTESPRQAIYHLAFVIYFPHVNMSNYR